jgi:hypothetical protein
MALMYVHCAFSEDIIAAHFSVSQPLVSKYISRARQALFDNVTTDWVCGLTPEELDLLPDDVHPDVACVVDGFLVKTQFTNEPTIRGLQRSEYTSDQSLKLLIFTAPNGHVISIPGLYSPDKSNESYGTIAAICNDPPLRHFLFNQCCSPELKSQHRHVILADRAYPDAQLTLEDADSENAEHNALFPPCEHRLSMKTPEFKGEEKQMSKDKVVRSRHVSSGRQVVERANRRLRESKLFKSQQPWQMTPAQLRQWAYIAAMLHNRYKEPLA